MDDIEFCLGVSWQGSQADETVLDALFDRFDVDDGEPCVQFEPEGPGTVAVTWRTYVPGHGEPYDEALAEARRVGQARFRSAGLTGRLRSASASTDEGSASWLADD